jgi:hypothetical protein
MEKYRQQLIVLTDEKSVAPIIQLIWGEGVDSGKPYDLKVVRKDRLLSRRNWQFGDRHEYVALIENEQGGRSINVF